MSGSTAVRAAIFAAGALVGGGVAAFVTSRHQPMSTYNRPLQGVSTSPPPIVGLDEARKTTLVDTGITPPTLLSPVLKYGHPGRYYKSFPHVSFSYSTVRLLGPFADPLIRKAYVAAYDRRLRHPAWVCHLWSIRKVPLRFYVTFADR